MTDQVRHDIAQRLGGLFWGTPEPGEGAAPPRPDDGEEGGQGVAVPT